MSNKNQNIMSNKNQNIMSNKNQNIMTNKNLLPYILCLIKLLF